MQWRIQEYLKGGHYRGGSRIDCRGGAKYTARVSAREILCATPTFYVIFKVPAGHTASVGINYSIFFYNNFATMQGYMNSNANMIMHPDRSSII